MLISSLSIHKTYVFMTVQLGGLSHNRHMQPGKTLIVITKASKLVGIITISPGLDPSH